MRPLFSVMFVLFFLLGCTTAEEEFMKTALSTEMIANPDGSSGSGVVIGPGLILTAYHVVVGEDGKVYSTVQCDGRSGKVVFADEQTRLALIKVFDEGNPVPVASRDPNPYEVCIIIGYPENVPFPYLSTGRVEALSTDHWMYYSAPTAAGSSGGGVFIREHGHWALIGIVQQVAPDFPNLGRGTPRDVIEQFLERYHARQ